MPDTRVSSGIGWTVVSAGVLLLDTQTGNTTELAYPEAAIWDMLARGDSPDRIAAKLGPIGGMDATAARALVALRMEEWLAAGLVRREGGDG